MTPAELAYRKTAATSAASGLPLLIALYDTLAGDIRRAAQAERENDIERRCREAGHALVVIGYLEDFLERGSGGELAAQLAGLYRTLRRNLIEAQAKRSPELLEEQMARVLQVRGSLQTMEMRGGQAGPEILPAAEAQTAPTPISTERSRLSWSA